MGPTIQNFDVTQDGNLYILVPRGTDASMLNLDDLRPCMAFINLRHMNLDIRWNVDLSDDDILALASTWPRIEDLLINHEWGWNTLGGITPNGLASLLQACPSLKSIALAFDTRGYTELPTHQFRGYLNSSSFTRPFRINVLDSVIEEESVVAVTDFLSIIIPHYSFIFIAWRGLAMSEHPCLKLYHARWWNVLRRLLPGFSLLASSKSHPS